MGKAALKRKNGNRKIIPLDRSRNSQFTKKDPFNDEKEKMLRDLGTLETMNPLELQNAAVYSMHKQVRRKALDLLPDDWRMFRFVAKYGCYSGTRAEAELRMKNLQTKEKEHSDQ
jgi:hypothetical protein